jgi:hypothetical protein
MSGKNRPGKTTLVEGSISYVVLCYARMRKGWFTAEDYAGFQLNRREKHKNFLRSAGGLVSNRYLITDTGDRWRITADGVQVLANLGAKRRNIQEHAAARNGQVSRAKALANLMTVADSNG